MLKAFYTSATGMRAQELLIDNTANNLANVNTTGFKRSLVEFADMMYNTSKQPGAPTSDGQNSPIGLQIGNGVRAVGTTTLFGLGPQNQSDAKTHMAINGDGFFKVTLPDGLPAYTRDGSFHRDATGLMVNGDGRPLDPPITIPQDIRSDSISISPTGIVSGIQNGTNTEFGNIQLARFSNPEGLEKLGGNLYRNTDASGPEVIGIPTEDGLGEIRQGFLEGSNVEVVTEMVALITAQRAYEVNSRAIRAGDEMLSNTSQLIR
jgi:flagellar basal-body rod protein FlgG